MARDDKIDYKELLESIHGSRKTLEHYRQRRRERIELYCGADYSTETGPAPRPLNFIRQYVDIVGRSLVPKSPQAMLSTFTSKQRPAVKAMEDWANPYFDRIDLGGTLRRAVVDALFQVGHVKVGLATPADAAASSYGIEPGDPYACPVSLDNIVFDVYANSKESLQYIGHWLRVPVDSVRDSKVYNLGRKEIEPTERRQFNSDGDEVANTLLGWAAHGTRREAFPMCDILEVFLPRQRKWCTFGGDGTGRAMLYKDGPIREVDFKGPHCGPFHWFGFGWPPDQLMPAGTLLNLTDLDMAANDTFRKLWRQATRCKENDVFEATSKEDADALQKAADGQVLLWSRFGAYQKVRTGGPLPELVNFLGVLRELFNYMSGNISTQGGLQAEADTATQEKLLAANSSGMITDMQGDVMESVKSVMDSMLWYFWENPFKIMQTEYKRKGYPRIERTLYPAGTVDPRTGRLMDLTREIAFEQIDMRLDPYSISFQTPQQRAAKLRGMFTQVIAPVYQLLKAQGLDWDMDKFMRDLGKYEDEPGYESYLNLGEPLDPTQQDVGGGEGGAAVSGEKTYRRQDEGPREPTPLEKSMQSNGAGQYQQNGQANGQLMGMG